MCECGGELPQGVPLRCVLCERTPFCARCSISDDPLICAICKTAQVAAADAHHKRLDSISGCELCQNKGWALKFCGECGKTMCERCTTNPSVHVCIQCSGCKKKRWTARCCYERLYCLTCLDTHERTNCEIKLRANCITCYRPILKFGAVRFKCCFPNCEQWPCMTCGKVGVGRYACVAHISPYRCPGCHNRYVMHGRGLVRLFYQKGGTILSREYCGNCYGTLVKPKFIALLRGNHARPWHLQVPKPLIEYILVEMLNALDTVVAERPL